MKAERSSKMFAEKSLDQVIEISASENAEGRSLHLMLHEEMAKPDNTGIRTAAANKDRIKSLRCSNGFTASTSKLFH